MPQHITPPTLTKTIRSHFSLSEINDLCFELNISYEDIPGMTRRDKARELVLFCERHGRLPELSQRVAELRPTAKTTEPSNMNEKTGRTAVIWVPIIVALITLTGVIITALLDNKSPKPTPVPPEVTDTPINEVSFEYPVTVRDNDTEQPISGAHVLIETGGGFAPKNGYTDSNGFVRITIDTELVGTKGRLNIEASGYQRFTQEINLILGELPDEVRLSVE